MSQTTRCAICETEYARTSRRFVACPNGHGKLIPYSEHKLIPYSEHRNAKREEVLQRIRDLPKSHKTSLRLFDTPVSSLSRAVYVVDGVQGVFVASLKTSESAIETLNGDSRVAYPVRRWIKKIAENGEELLRIACKK